MSERLILRKKDVLAALDISDETLARIASAPENADIWPKPFKLRNESSPVWLADDIKAFLLERKKRGTE